MFDFSKLIFRIKRYYKSITRFAVAMDRSRQNISNKLNNRTEWTSDEIYEACKLLEIKQNDIGEYFFTLKESE